MNNGNKKEKVNPRICSISCRNVNIEMEYPVTRGQAESYLWYIYHGAEVYIGNDGQWYLNVPSRCNQLLKGGVCGVAGRQPEICSQHSQNGAKKLDDVARYRFTSEKELLSYLKEKRPALFKKLPLATRRAANGFMPAKRKKIKNIPSCASECADCGLCCKYMNIVVDRPTDQEDVETLLWYQYHRDTNLHLDQDNDYGLHFPNRCGHLDENNLCKIYSRRPSICKQFSLKGCHGNDVNESVKITLDTEKALMGHLKKRRPGLFKKLSRKLRRLAAR
jgi:Fe-S-cluster containining protein